MPTEAKKGITVKVDAALHAEVKQYLEEHGMTMAEFVTLALTDELHPKFNMKEEKNMGNMRTLAFQVPEDLFQRIKDYLQRNNMTQKEFVIGLIETELERDLAEREGMAAGEQEEAAAEDDSETVSEETEDFTEEQDETAAEGDFEAASEETEEFMEGQEGEASEGDFGINLEESEGMDDSETYDEEESEDEPEDENEDEEESEDEGMGFTMGM
ncbi:MAG: hypothetical protein K1W40_19835 [Schaedlerella sp.]|uniref:hypothetical protein n=1 Tax=Schaedlerella sp. TaxID=2676057 RepID=UPI003528E9C8